jgi:hypothetical protein
MNYSNFYINLMEAFGDDQKKKWLRDNPSLTHDQVDVYIKWFDEIRKSKPVVAKTVSVGDVPEGDDRFDISKYNNWHSFESFVDAVRAQMQLKGERLSDKLEVIDAKPLFKKNGIEVYYADTPQACVKYKGDMPYSWCIARADSNNMFYSHRLSRFSPAFYFVKDVEATQKELRSDKIFSGKFSNKWHFFVIQVLKTARIDDLADKSYVVTSADNDGDVVMSWNEIIKIQPKLNGLQSEFLPKPLSDEEVAIIKKYRGGLSLGEFNKLSYNEKERFLDVYSSMYKPITDEIFNVLPRELKNKYIGMSIGLSDVQYDSIQSDKNLLKRYAQMVEKKFEMWLKHTTAFDLVSSEIDVLIKYGILERYVNKLNPYYVDYLVTYSNDKQQLQLQIIDILLNAGWSDEKIFREYLVMQLMHRSKDQQQTIEMLFKMLSSKNIKLKDNLADTFLEYSTDKQKTIDVLLRNEIAIVKTLHESIVYELIVKSLDRQRTIEMLLNNNVSLTNKNVETFLEFSSDRQRTIEILLSKNVSLTDRNVKLFMIYSSDRDGLIDMLLSKNVPLTDSNVDLFMSRTSDYDKTRQKIYMLKLKQQLSEIKFNYREFY